jgi:hypothetical protein
MRIDHVTEALFYVKTSFNARILGQQPHDMGFDMMNVQDGVNVLTRDTRAALCGGPL